jgi:hypothetical protein
MFGLAFIDGWTARRVDQARPFPRVLSSSSPEGAAYLNVPEIW